MPAVRSPVYDDKIDEILEKASKLMAEQGYAFTSMSQVAEACGSSKARLYHYFPSKEHVLFEILIRHINLLLKSYYQEIEGTLLPRDKLLKVIETVMDVSTKAPNQHKVFLNELEVLPDDMKTKVIKKQREFVVIVSSLLREIRPAGVSSDHSFYSTAAMLLFGMVNWTHTWFRHDGPVPKQKLSKYIYDLFLKGFETAQYDD